MKLNSFRINALLILFSIIASGVYVNAFELSEKLNRQWGWFQYTTQQGLPGNNILDIVETPSGTIWVHTTKGIAWSEGHFWNKIDFGLIEKSPINDIYHDDFSGVFVNCKNKLYHVTKTSIIKEIPLMYKGKFLRLIRSAPYGGTKHIMTAFLSDANNVGMFICDGTKITPLSAPPNLTSFSRIYAPDNGTIWINTSRGLYYLNGTVWEKKFPEHNSIRIFRSMKNCDSGGEGLFSINFPEELQGTWRYDRYGNIEKAFPTDILLQHDIDYYRDIGIGYFLNGEVYEISGENYKEVKQLPHIFDQMSGYRFTSEGDLLVFTALGLYIYKMSMDMIERIDRPEDKISSVNELLRDKNGTLWAATAYGIHKYHADGSHEFIGSLLGEKALILTGMTEDNNGNIWVSSGGYMRGVYKWNGTEWKHYSAKDGLGDGHVHKIHKANNGDLWFFVLSDSSLYRGNSIYKYKSGKFEKFSLPEEFSEIRVYCMAETPDSALWFGSANKIFKYKKGSWKIFKQSNAKLNIGGAFTMATAPDGKLWFGNRLSGFGYINSDTAVYIKNAEMLGASEVWNMKFAADSTLWLATSQGLFRYKNNLLTRFDHTVGLSDTRIWSLLIKKGSILMGSVQGGISKLNITRYINYLPKVKLTNISVAEDDVMIEWDATGYWSMQNPEEILTRWRLDGGKWSDWTTTRSLNMNNLSSGDYTIELQAANLFGKIDKRPVASTFTIANPFYLQTEFIILFAIFVAIALYSVVLLSQHRQTLTANKNIEAKNKEIEEINRELQLKNQRIEEQHKELQEFNEAKNKYFKIIAHDLLNPFNSFLNNSKYLMDNFYDLSVEEIQSCIKDINLSSKSLYNLLENLLQWTNAQTGRLVYNPKQIKLHTAAEETRALFQMLLDLKKLTYKAEYPQETLIYADPNMLRTILRNLLNNAIKFTESGGTITISAQRSNEGTMLTIEDSGIGMDEESIEKLMSEDIYYSTLGTKQEKGSGLGMILCREFVRQHGGTIDLISNLGKGSIFRIFFPEAKKDMQ